MIIPAINAQSLEEFVRRIRIVREEASMIQIDVSDGIFAQPKNFAQPSIVQSELQNEQIDIHLMVKDVQRAIEEWAPISPARIAFHIESCRYPEKFLTQISQHNIKAGIALAPDSPLSVAEEYISYADYLLLLGVQPGKSGQTFNPCTPDRVKGFHELYPNTPIGVDGGIGIHLIHPLIHAGASFIVIGSDIFRSPDPVLTLQKLQRTADDIKL